MSWCCDVTESAFRARLDCGEFVVAGYDSGVGKVLFFGGFNMCHRSDYSRVIAATRRAAELIEAEGISNFKLSSHGCIRYCKGCGANLLEHYGADGGLLRDDDYVKELRSA